MIADSRLAKGVNSLPLGLTIADADGVIVFRNTFAEGFGSGRHADALVSAAVDDIFAEVASSGYTEQQLDLYGPPRQHMVLVGRTIVEDGQRTGSMVTIEDVTERHRVETLRKDFVANVSHELKTPVGAIVVLAEALEEAVEPDVVKRLTLRLHTEAFRMADTIDDLLMLSQIEGGETPESLPVPIDAVLADVVDRASSIADNAEVTVTVDPIEGRVLVMGDRKQLTSAIANLVDNAIKYSNPGTSVGVSAVADLSWVTVRVVDQGVGIPAADRERIFERFYRVDQARSRETGGTGLGLAIVRHIVLGHGGEIAVESREGEGSEFTLKFPTPNNGNAINRDGDHSEPDTHTEVLPGCGA